MAVLMYRDPADGNYKPLTMGGGSGADEVLISSVQPTDPLNELWVNTMEDTLPGNARSIAVISTNTALGSTSRTDYVYICTSALTATLPTAMGNVSIYTIKRTGTGNVTVATTAGQTIDGAATFVLDAQWMAVDLVSNGANWVIV